MDQLAEKVRYYRKARGLSIEQLGTRAGYTNGTMINQIEKGMKKPSPKQLKAIAGVLEVSVSDLTGDVALCRGGTYHADGDHQTVYQHVEGLMPEELTVLVQRIVHAEFEAYLEKIKVIIEEVLTSRMHGSVWHRVHEEDETEGPC